MQHWWYIEICGSVDPKLLERALRQVLTEAEALRVQKSSPMRRPWQVVSDLLLFDALIDVSGEPDARATGRIMDGWLICATDRAHVWTIVPVPLFKASADRFFCYSAHHLGWTASNGAGDAPVAEVYTQRCKDAHAGGFICTVSALLEDDAAMDLGPILARPRILVRLFGRPG